MHKFTLLLTLLSICLALSFDVAFAKTDGHGHWSTNKGPLPEVGSLELDLMIILQRTQFEASQPAYLASSDHKIHDLIRAARIDMFDTYDALMAGDLCTGLKSRKRKIAVIEYATILLQDYLLRLSKLDLHNGCLALQTEFPSVAYGPQK